MDYEKAYKAVLKTATQWIKDGCTDKEKICLECVFPELRESEDERIRRELIEYLRGDLDDITTDDTDRWIAYLEKQKEQKPISQEDFDTAKHEALWEEQKPVKKQDYSGLNDLERAILRGFLCAGVENVPVTIIKETAQDCLAHIPTEWSEEDKKMLSDLRNTLGCLMNAGAITFKTKKKFSNWLKSLRPDSYKNCNSRWKPSEEQMDSLRDTIVQTKGYSYSMYLPDLYEQLKKL